MITTEERNKAPNDTTSAPLRDRGLTRVDTGPVRRRLNGMVGTKWNEVLDKINGLAGMRHGHTRAAYLRFVGENVAASEGVLPEAPFYVGDFEVRNEEGDVIKTSHACLVRRPKRVDARAGAETMDLPAPTETELPTDVTDFLGNRVVGKRGRRLLWFVQNGNTKKTRIGTNDRDEPVFKITLVYRQDRALNSRETEHFSSLPENIRDQILAMAPV